MDPTTLVMEHLAAEWAACIAGFSALAMSGTVVLVATIAIVAALASLPAAGQRQTATGDGESHPQTPLRPEGAPTSRPTHLRLVAAATTEAGPFR